ncbi:hypothetical protein LguiA_036545 [Lonicera macranthoides]
MAIHVSNQTYFNERRLEELYSSTTRKSEPFTSWAVRDYEFLGKECDVCDSYKEKIKS